MDYVTICRESGLLEGEMANFVIRGREFVVVWPEGGEPAAFDSFCPHQGVPLGQGHFNGQVLTCPAHQWVFDGVEGQGLNADCQLKRYPLRIRDGLVEVKLIAFGELYDYE